MSVLVVFATTEGHTKKIAERIKETMMQIGIQAELYDCGHRTKPPELSKFDAIVVAGSIHQRRHQDALGDFVRVHRSELESVPTALISVSLSAAFKEGRPEAQSYVDEFFAKSAWQPSQTLLVGGALKHSEYDYFKEQFVQYVVLQDRDIASGQEDNEFTDWEALSQFITSFVNSIKT